MGQTDVDTAEADAAVTGVELITEVLAGEFAGVTNCCSVTLLMLSRPPGRSSLVSQLELPEQTRF